MRGIVEHAAFRWRRRWIGGVATFVMALLMAVSTPAASPVRAASEGPVRSFTLENGLQVYVTEGGSAPAVTVMVGYRVGSRDEPIGKRGMAHLLEHMMFKGTAQFGPGEYDRLIQSVGGSLNAFTSFDMTGYWASLPASQLELALTLEADRMENALITEADLASEREVVKEEYRLRMQNAPGGLAVNHMFATVFADTRYSWTPSGFLNELDEITTADLRRFYERYYSVNNAVLVVAGHADVERVRELVERIFGDLEQQFIPERERIQVQPIALGAPVIEVEYPVQNRLVVGAYLTPDAQHPDAAALDVLGAVLSLGASSRMHQQVVRTEQVAVTASAGPLALNGAGLFLVEAVHDDVSGSDVMAALQGVIAGVVEDPPTPKELQKAVNQLSLTHALRRDSLHGKASAIVDAVLMTNDIATFTDAVDRYRAVTVDDVVRVAEEYLVGKPIQWVHVAPTKLTEQNDEEGGSS